MGQALLSRGQGDGEGKLYLRTRWCVIKCWFAADSKMNKREIMDGGGKLEARVGPNRLGRGGMT